MPRTTSPVIQVVCALARHYVNCIKKGIFTTEEVKGMLETMIDLSKKRQLIIHGDKLFTITQDDNKDDVLFDIATRTYQKGTERVFYLKKEGGRVPLNIVVKSTLMVTFAEKCDSLSAIPIREMKASEEIKKNMAPLVRTWKVICRKQHRRDIFGSMD